MKTYSVYAFRVGNRMRESSVFHLFTDPGKQILVSYYFWGVRTSDEFVLVDTGFSLESAKKRNAEFMDFVAPENLLHTIGVDPLEIRKVILTHLHWDHCASFDMCKNAVFYVQQKDFHFFTGPFAQCPTIQQFIDTDALAGLLRLNYEGRLRIVEGELPIAQGITVIPMGGHTPGSQIVRVAAYGKDIILAADAIPFYQNLSDGIPTGLYCDLREVLTAHGRIGEFVQSPNVFVPGHDPLVASKFSFARGVVTIE